MNSTSLLQHVLVINLFAANLIYLLMQSNFLNEDHWYQLEYKIWLFI